MKKPFILGATFATVAGLSVWISTFSREGMLIAVLFGGNILLAVTAAMGGSGNRERVRHS
jgi:hypothetical protein